MQVPGILGFGLSQVGQVVGIWWVGSRALLECV